MAGGRQDGLPTWGQRKFAQVYVQTGDRRKAAVAAGSKSKDLYRAGTMMLANLKVKALIEELEGKADAAAIQSVAEVKAEVHSLINEGIQLARVGTPLIGKNGALVEDLHTGLPVRRPDINGLLKGAELKGKTVAMFTDRQELAGEMDGMSQDELKTFLLSALLSNTLLLEEFCREEAVRKKVLEIERRDAESRQSGEGDGAAEADSVSPESEAGGVPQGRLH